MPRTSLDKSSTQWLIDLFYGSLESVRSRRISIEYEWLLDYKAWQGWPSQSYTLPLPDGATHYFIPHARRVIERNVARATKLLMPQTEWFQVLPNDLISYDHAESVQSVYKYFYEKKIKTKRLISSLTRCLYLYDFAIVSTSVKIERDSVWPYHRDVDPFNFYIFPDTASTLEEAQFLFEDRIIPLQVYNSLVNRENKEQSYYLELDASELRTPVWPYHLVERIAYRGLSIPSDFSQGTGNTRQLRQYEINEAYERTKNNLSAQNKSFVHLTKLYFRIASTWYLAEICNNLIEPKVVRLDEVENVPMYRWASARVLPGELYLNSPMGDVRTLQTLTNAAISQTEAVRQVVAEPPVAMDMTAAGRLDSYTFENRRIWRTPGNPKDLMMQLDIKDTTDIGLRTWQVYLQQINSLAGSGSIAEGQPGRNMPRAGFAVDSLINLAMTDLEDVANTIEQELLTPMLADAYHIFQEYVPRSQIIKIPGKAREMIQSYSPEDLYGDYTFSWIGSLGFQDISTRADKFFQLLQLLANPQLSELLAQQGVRVDLATLIKFIYTLGIGERGLSNIIIPIPQEELEQRAESIAKQDQIQELMLSKQIESIDSKNSSQILTAQAAMTKARGDIDTKYRDLDFKEIEKLLSISNSDTGEYSESYEE